MLYLHGICNTEGLEAFSICSSFLTIETFLEALCDWTCGLILRDSLV